MFSVFLLLCFLDFCCYVFWIFVVVFSGFFFFLDFCCCFFWILLLLFLDFVVLFLDFFGINFCIFWVLISVFFGVLISGFFLVLISGFWQAYQDPRFYGPDKNYILGGGGFW
jgi:hypothetical protein